MKKTNIEVRAAWFNLSKLIQSPMKGADSQHLALLALKLQPIIKTHEEAFKKILDKFCKKNEDGSYVTINDGKDYDIPKGFKESFDLEVKDLSDSVVDIEWEKKKLNNDVQISALEIMPLLDFIYFSE